MPDSEKPTLPPATERGSYTSWTFDKLRLGDTDRQGHVNNAVFATFAETGRIEFMRDDLLDLDRKSLGFVVARVEIDFRGELHWPGRVEIGTRLLSVGRTSWRLEHGMFVGDRCVATAMSVMVTIDAATRRPTPVPEVLRTWLEQRVTR
ncbi:MAG TPA: thioesterase family protein [Stellaceae bacterium]|jgi:acyl-CoA thioester hydrolase|nr:thioesterase family protein [Stellaceae bacterium]